MGGVFQDCSVTHTATLACTHAHISVFVSTLTDTCPHFQSCCTVQQQHMHPRFHIYLLRPLKPSYFHNVMRKIEKIAHSFHSFSFFCAISHFLGFCLLFAFVWYSETVNIWLINLYMVKKYMGVKY